MSVILLILKIIGGILLFVLGLLLLILAAVFFVPVRYRISGSFFGEPVLQIRVSWLLGMVRYSYARRAKESAGSIRICGIRPGKRAGGRDAEEEPREEEEMPDETEEEPWDEDTDDVSRRPEDDTRGDKALSADTDSRTDKKADAAPRGDKDADAAPRSGKKSDMRAGSGKSVDAGFERDAGTGEPGPADRLKEAFHKAKSIITDESNRLVVSSVWFELLYLLRHFRFRHIRVEVIFSLADPAATGQALGVLCMMPFLYGRDVNITPDFEVDRMYAEGEAEAAGRMRGVHFLVSLLRLLRRREVRSLIRRLRSK